MVNWKKNLVFIWLSQFLSMAGFSFAMPFAPYFIQEMGVTDPRELRIWIAVFSAAAPITFTIFGPIWGWIADRHGRRPMLLRANLGAAVVLALMGRAESVAMLVVMRVFQGVLTGTITASQTLVASHTPSHRSGFAMGVLSSGMFSGAMAGVALGGLFADRFGYRNAFFLASVLLVLASLMVMFGTTEDFLRAVPKGGNARERMRRGWFTLLPAFPLMLTVAFLAVLRQFDMAYLPLLVQDIHGSIAGAATRMGWLGAAASGAGFLSGFVFGHLSDKRSPQALARWGALVGGLLLVPQAFAGSITILLVLRFCMAFCIGGLDPIFQSLLSRMAPHGERGFFFGWASSLRSLGWGFAPLLSGVVAATVNVRAVFVVGGVLFILLAWAMPRMLKSASTD